MEYRSAIETDGGFESWHQVTCRNFSLSECRPTSTQGFRARISGRSFGSLCLSKAVHSGIDSFRMTRDSSNIRKDHRDHFMLYLVLHGRMDIEQAERRAIARSGDMYLYDQTLPFNMTFYSGNHSILVNIPRSLLVARMPLARQLTGQRIAGDSKTGALCSSVIRQIADFDTLAAPQLEDRLATSALDIISTAVEAGLTGQHTAPPGEHRLLPQVQRYILEHLHDPQLDIEAIAKAQNVAPRTLNRIFASEGTTPIRWLWRQRLAASHQLLAQGLAESVTDAAYSSGFNDVSHFGRSFKREFGHPPRAMRQLRDERDGR